MFDRFSEDTREVMMLAQDEARALGHDHIGAEHLLLGLLRAREPAAIEFGVGLDEARERVRRFIGQGGERTIGELQFAEEAKRALSGALRDAMTAGHEEIRPVHLLAGALSAGSAARIVGAPPPEADEDDGDQLLALAADPGTVTARALAALGVGIDQLRDAVEVVRGRPA
jgi:ATP-dependent Clp protease ATP-binding subunit ClpA